MTPVTTEIIRTELATYYKVSRVFPNAASAAAALLALERINPEAFAPVEQIAFSERTTEIEDGDGVFAEAPDNAGEFQAIRQHDAAEGEVSPCIGSVCGVGE